MLLNKINCNQLNMDQIWMKNKFKGCFKNLKSQTWKLRRKERKEKEKKDHWCWIEGQ